jgi:hypothetical protein
MAEIECPRCDEADERVQGVNKCGLCECEFYVGHTGKVMFVGIRPVFRRKPVTNGDRRE